MKKLNLGCGPNWSVYQEYEGLDIIDYGQKYIGNVLELLLTFDDGVYDEVMANHFLEHFSQDELKILIFQVHRILRQSGTFKIVVPHKEKEKSWDLTHKTFWNEYTVRSILHISNPQDWEIESIITNSRKDIHSLLRKQ